jgi:hypothetical protein
MDFYFCVNIGISSYMLLTVAGNYVNIGYREVPQASSIQSLHFLMENYTQ